MRRFRSLSLRGACAVVAQPFARNERYGCGILLAGAISCRNDRMYTSQNKRLPRRCAPRNDIVGYPFCHCETSAHTGRGNLMQVPPINPVGAAISRPVQAQPTANRKTENRKDRNDSLPIHASLFTIHDSLPRFTNPASNLLP